MNLYPLIDQPASIGSSVLPAGFFGVYDVTSGLCGPSAALLSATGETTQVKQSGPVTQLPNGVVKRFGLGQFLSAPLQTGDYGSAAWSIAFAAQFSGAAINKVWNAHYALFLVDGTTGTVKTTIYQARFPIGPMSRTGAGELTVYANPFALAGAAWSAQLGDYLALELIVNVTNNSGQTISATPSIFTSGGTPITADDVLASDAQAVLTAPYSIAF